MTATIKQLNANRDNAQKGSGPRSAEGKAISRKNAERHGVLSARLLLEDENAGDFDRLLDELARALRPHDAIEATLVERIAITLWRQRRLVGAETARLRLRRRDLQVAKSISSELGLGLTKQLSQEDVAPFEPAQEAWCRDVLKEAEWLGDWKLELLEKAAPLVYAQLKEEAEADEELVSGYVSRHEAGLNGFVAELAAWCRAELTRAEERPNILALAEDVRCRDLVMPTHALELLSRYQTTLDNQLYKALRALRDAQEWRLKTLEPVNGGSGPRRPEQVSAE